MSKTNTLSPFVSNKIKFWSFVSMLLLVFVHGYNLNDRFLVPWKLVYEPLTVTSFSEYFFSNGIFRFRMPMLFIISGYLYALHDGSPNLARIKKRSRTLLLPYLLWSAISIFATYLLEIGHTTKAVLEGSNFFLVNNKNIFIHDMGFGQIVYRWLFNPLSYQLWFLMALFIYNIAYPFLRWCVTNRIAKHIFFTVLVLIWLYDSHLYYFVSAEGILFFSLGVWMQKTSFDIQKPNKWLNPYFWSFAFIALAVLKTWLAFNGKDFVPLQPLYLAINILYKIVSVGGLITCWYSLNKLVIWCMDRKWFKGLSSFSFFIYAAHAPLIAYVITVTLLHLSNQRLLTFILLPTAVIVACIVTGATLRRVLPTVYRILTGGRGTL